MTSSVKRTDWRLPSKRRWLLVSFASNPSLHDLRFSLKRPSVHTSLYIYIYKITLQALQCDQCDQHYFSSSD
jgi:hypothetical protein